MASTTTTVELDYSSDRYHEICAALGADPSIKFVRVLVSADGTESIDYTVGKPDEVRWLYGQAQTAGFRRSKRMVDALQAESYGRGPWHCGTTAKAD